MPSSGAVGSFRARGSLHNGVTRSRTSTRDDASSRKRPLSRGRSPLGAEEAGGGGRFGGAAGGGGGRQGGIFGGGRPP